MTSKMMLRTIMLSGLLLLSGAAEAAAAKILRVCADPGNMPMSNERREGYENKIADVLGDAMGMSIEYYWKPFIERGLTRTTLYDDHCDLMLDMPPDTERVLTSIPVYRTTFVLASRSDQHLSFKNLDDPRLKALKIGVFQMSALREALSRHGVKNNTVVHYLSYDADLQPTHQPSYQLQELINGDIDVAAVWGPFAGYYKAMKHAPISIEAANLMDDQTPLEFDLALAMRTRDQDLKQAVDAALQQKKAEIRKILDDYGVPLVACDHCLISGDLPSHGPYHLAPPEMTAAQAYRKYGASTVPLFELEQWLKDGANPNDELNDAVIAADPTRIDYLLSRGADINARDKQGATPLINAVRKNDLQTAQLLLDRHADVNHDDRDGWTPVLYAAWANYADMVKLLTAKGADVEALTPDGRTALSIAAQYGKTAAAKALIDAGAKVNRAVGKAGYTPLMLSVIGGATDATELLLANGAEVNAHNSGGVTALMIAAAGNRVEAAERLLKAGAAIDPQTEDGRTALSIARAQNSEAVLNLLQQKPASSGKQAALSTIHTRT